MQYCAKFTINKRGANMERQEKNLISRVTEKSIENDLRNYIGEIELLNKNLDNLKTFITTINFSKHETKATIDTYNRAISIYDHIANKFSTLRNLLQLYKVYFKAYNLKSLNSLFEEFKRKCKNLSDRIDRLETKEIETLFSRTPAAKEIKMTAINE